MLSEPTVERPTPSPLWALLIPVAVFVFYANSLSAPFIFDDIPGIKENATLRQLWPLSGPLQPPDNGSGVTARPFTNLTLAVNYAIGGLDVRSYHLVNCALHAIAGLLLFGILRRTFLQPPLIDRFGDVAFGLALSIALLWAVHPLQTEAVTCSINRAELLAGLFYLLTLYAFIRSAEHSSGPNPSASEDVNLTPDRAIRRSRLWQVVGFASCVLGMASKEVMVGAPLIVFWYDAVFVSGTWREAWRRHHFHYVALASTWLLLAWLMVSSGGNRGGAVGFSSSLSTWHYLLTSAGAIAHYLQLSIWPRPLILDYGTAVQTSLVAVWQPGLAILGLLGATVVAIRRWPIAGFLGGFFFFLLAPTSSVVPIITQTLAERRMYLPLAAVLTIGVIAGHRLVGQWYKLGVLVFSLALGTATWLRNEDYRSKVFMWQYTVSQLPGNSRAWYNLGHELFAINRVQEARAAFEEALRLDPDNGKAHAGLASTLDNLGRYEEALSHAQAAVKLVPAYPGAHITLGLVYSDLRNYPEALQAFETALRLNREAMSSFHAANVLVQLNRLPEAESYYRQALALDPTMAMAHFNFGVTLAIGGREREALPELQEALRLDPALPNGPAALEEVQQRLAAPTAPSASGSPPRTDVK